MAWICLAIFLICDLVRALTPSHEDPVSFGEKWIPVLNMDMEKQRLRMVHNFRAGKLICLMVQNFLA